MGFSRVSGWGGLRLYTTLKGFCFSQSTSYRVHGAFPVTRVLLESRWVCYQSRQLCRFWHVSVRSWSLMALWGRSVALWLGECSVAARHLGSRDWPPLSRDPRAMQPLVAPSL